PRDVVAPPCTGGRVAAVRAGLPDRPGCARPHRRMGLLRGRAARGIGRPGGDDPPALSGAAESPLRMRQPGHGARTALPVLLDAAGALTALPVLLDAAGAPTVVQ